MAHQSIALPRIPPRRNGSINLGVALRSEYAYWQSLEIAYLALFAPKSMISTPPIGTSSEVQYFKPCDHAKCNYCDGRRGLGSSSEPEVKAEFGPLYPDLHSYSVAEVAPEESLPDKYELCDLAFVESTFVDSISPNPLPLSLSQLYCDRLRTFGGRHYDTLSNLNLSPLAEEFLAYHDGPAWQLLSSKFRIEMASNALFHCSRSCNRSVTPFSRMRLALLAGLISEISSRDRASGLEEHPNSVPACPVKSNHLRNNEAAIHRGDIKRNGIKEAGKEISKDANSISGSEFVNLWPFVRDFEINAPIRVRRILPSSQDSPMYGDKPNKEDHGLSLISKTESNKGDVFASNLPDKLDVQQFDLTKADLGISPKIAVVGCRNLSAQMWSISQMIGEIVALSQCWLISGGARGADLAAEIGAFRAQGKLLEWRPLGLNHPWGLEQWLLLNQKANTIFKTKLEAFPPISENECSHPSCSVNMGSFMVRGRVHRVLEAVQLDGGTYSKNRSDSRDEPNKNSLLDIALRESPGDKVISAGDNAAKGSSMPYTCSHQKTAIREFVGFTVSSVNDDSTFSRPTAMERNHILYAQSDYAIIVQSRFRVGGTWHGASSALRKSTGNILTFSDQSDASKALIDRGAVPVPFGAICDLHQDWIAIRKKFDHKCCAKPRVSDHADTRTDEFSPALHSKAVNDLINKFWQIFHNSSSKTDKHLFFGQ